MEAYIVPLEIDSRERTERKMQAEKHEMLARLIKLIEASIDTLVERAEVSAVLLRSAQNVYMITRMNDKEWYHYALSGDVDGGNTPHVYYYLRVPDGVITRLVIERDRQSVYHRTEQRFTVKVELDELTISEIGMLMAQINSITNTH